MINSKELKSIEELIATDNSTNWDLALILYKATIRENTSYFYELMVKYHGGKFTDMKHRIHTFMSSNFSTYEILYIHDFPIIINLNKFAGIMVADVTRCGSIHLNI